MGNLKGYTRIGYNGVPVDKYDNPIEEKKGIDMEDLGNMFQECCIGLLKFFVFFVDEYSKGMEKREAEDKAKAERRRNITSLPRKG
jgi:hypothetical protein